jgi:hypothetical protein
MKAVEEEIVNHPSSNLPIESPYIKELMNASTIHIPPYPTRTKMTYPEKLPFER